jgi:N-acetylneuraminic acid mutarotase
MSRRNRLIFAAAALACLALTAAPAFAQTAQPTGAWTQKKPIPTARNEVALAGVGGKLYVVGGGIQGNAVPLVDEYDPTADSWRSRAPMPKGLDHLGIAVVNGKIITVGGFIGSVHRGAVTDVYEYNPATDTWRALAPLKAGVSQSFSISGAGCSSRASTRTALAM